MAQIADALFAWDAVQARSDLVLFSGPCHLPDKNLIAVFQAKRGEGSACLGQKDSITPSILLRCLEIPTH